jgi:hypothetical protein
MKYKKLNSGANFLVLLILRVFRMGVEKWVSGKTQHPLCLHQSRTTAAIEYNHSKIKDC